MLWFLAFTADASAADDLATTEPSEPAGPAWPVLYPGQCTEDEPNFDIELLYYEAKPEQGIALCNERLKIAPTADLYWLKARFMYEIGERFQRTDTSIDKVAHYQQMLATVEAGLKLAPGDPHLRFARGVAMGRLGTTRGVLSSLFMAKDVETDWLFVANHPTYRYSSLGAVEMLPCDAYHALGIYYRLVPDWWIVQVIAGTRGDLNKAVAYNVKSTVCKPKEVENWKELGVSQLCLSQKTGDAALAKAGVASLQQAMALPAHRDRAKIDQKHSKMVIAEPSLACEYSRDGQQDLDQKKLPSE